MALDDLNDKLHSRDFHSDRIRRTALPYAKVVSSDAAKIRQTEGWQDPEVVARQLEENPRNIVAFLLSKKSLKIIAFTLGGIVVFAVIAGITMTIRSSLFQTEDIQLSVVGPGEVASAESVVFTVEYDNDNWASLENAMIVFEYPEAFRPEAAPNLVINTARAEHSIGTTPSRGEGTITLRGKFYSYQGDQLTIAAVLRYSPSHLSTSFEKRIQKDVRVVSSPIVFEIVAPLESAPGQKIEYEIQYSNNGTTDFPHLHVKIDYPDEFEFIDADPRPAEGDSIWKIGVLNARSQGKIVIRGILRGEREQQKAIRGSIGFFQGDGKFVMYSEHERRTRIVASPFVILQVINGNMRDAIINPGNDINYKVIYKNEGNVGIRDAILTVELASPYLDYRTVDFDSVYGSYDQYRKVITWKASDFPPLARVEPGQSDAVSFSIKTFDNLKERFPNARNLTIQSIAKIDSPDIPVLTGLTKVVASSEVTAKINTAVETSLTGLYQDTVFGNSGPQPMVVGQETTYTMYYSVTNTLNEVKDGRVIILLPTGIRHTGKREGAGEQITFNERTNELVWDIGLLAPRTTRTIAFQIAVIPEPRHASGSNGDSGESVIFVNSAIFTGKDSFTGKQFQLEKMYEKRFVLPAP